MPRGDSCALETRYAKRSLSISDLMHIRERGAAIYCARIFSSRLRIHDSSAAVPLSYAPNNSSLQTRLTSRAHHAARHLMRSCVWCSDRIQARNLLGEFSEVYSGAYSGVYSGVA